MRGTQESLFQSILKSSQAHGACPLIKVQFYCLGMIHFCFWVFFLLYPRKCPSVSIKKWPPGNWNPSKHLTEITWDIPNDNFSAETLLNSWPTKITRDNNCVGGKPPCFGEICCTTIITDRNFGTRGETLLKQKPIKMDNCCGLDGKWKLEGPWSDC